MNKKIAIISALIAIAMPIAPAFGSDSETTPSNYGSSRNEFRQQRETRRNELAALRENIQAGKTELAQARLEFKNNKEKMNEERCKNVETRIATRINRYENNQQMFQTVYGNMQTRLERLLAKLKTAGADTSKLEIDLATLKTKIAKLKADQADFISTLKETQAFACGKSEGQFKAKFDEARKVPDVIKADRQDIKNFFQTTIKTDLKVIREFLASQKTTSESESSPRSGD
jgi:peptidoglycan hydrolase CwlO-like protein